jgi:ankyrin repeat protein
MPEVDADAAVVDAAVLKALDARPGAVVDWLTLVSISQGPHGPRIMGLRGWHPNHGTLLHRAVDARSPEYCALLIARGAVPSQLDSLGATPLIRCASRIGDPTRLDIDDPTRLDIDVAAVLLRCGADVDATDPMGRTALHHAASVGNAPLLTLLADWGADVNRIGGLHRTALHTAAMRGHLPAIQALVHHGADVTITDELSGMTALDVAVKFRHWNVATWLKEAAGYISPGGDNSIAQL